VASFDYDVLVIGGGPAGSSAAIFARQHGLGVCVVEKETFPRFRIGESLLPHGNALLEELGVWPKLAAAGFIKKFGAYFFLANGRAAKEVVFTDGIIPGPEFSFQVERAKFDAILLDHAREAGAEVLMPAIARQVGAVAGGHAVMLDTPAGPQHVTARWVLDAGGRENLFPCETKRALEPSPWPKRVAVYNHFINTPRPSGRDAGHTVVVRLADGWFWLIPIDATRTSAGLVATARDLRASGLKPAEFFQRAVARSPRLRELMDGATPALGWQVTGDYSYFRRELAAERLLLLGDAGGFFDPIFSSGVYVALFSARRAVELLARAHRAGRGLRPAERRDYTRAIKRHAGVFQKLITAFYDNDSFAVFMCERAPLRLSDAANSIVAGHSRLTFPIWWRFRAFLLVCRLQKRFALVPRIDFSGMASAG
jgi:flavin-dependent dehydrogenase